MFYEVYGLKKEDLEVYFRNMGVLENFKSFKFRRNIKWGNVFDKLELIVFFIKGLMGYLEYSESELLEKEVKVVLCVLKFLVLKQEMMIIENIIDLLGILGKFLRGGIQIIN